MKDRVHAFMRRRVKESCLVEIDIGVESYIHVPGVVIGPHRRLVALTLLPGGCRWFADAIEVLETTQE